MGIFTPIPKVSKRNNAKKHSVSAKMSGTSPERNNATKKTVGTPVHRFRKRSKGGFNYDNQ